MSQLSISAKAWFMRNAIAFLITCASAIVISSGTAFSAAPPLIPIRVYPGVIQPTNGKLPSAMNLTVACGDNSVHDFSEYTLTVIGDGLTLSSQPTNSGTCSITYSVTIAPNTSPGGHPIQLVDKNKNTVGTAEIAVLDNSAGPLPPGLPPQVDVLWEVMSQKSCSDVFGSRVAERNYCVQLKIGNDSGYAIQIAGVGFATKIANQTDPVTIANSSYASTRAVLLTENVTNGRNIVYNILQATGVLMSAFTPYFGTGKHPNGTVNNARTNWTTAASIVSGPLLSAFNIVAPNPVITQLNNLDDQSFRDNRVIPNNTQLATVVFVEKPSLTYQLAAIGTRYSELYPKMTKQLNSEDPAALLHSGLKPTIENSTNSRRMISPSRGGFSPLLVKLALGSVVIVGDQIQYLQRVQIQNTAAPPSPTGPLNASPSSLSFPSQTILNPSPVQTVTLTNTGSSTLSGISAQISKNPEDFTVQNGCSSNLSGGATCAVSVGFVPYPTVGASPARTGELKVSYVGGSGPFTIPLSGSATNPADAVAVTTSLDFGTVKFGPPTGKATATLTIANVGAAGPVTSLAVAAPSGPAAAAFVPALGPNCAGTLGPGIICSVTYTFTPAAVGSQSATVAVNYQVNGVAAAPRNVALSGTGQ